MCWLGSVVFVWVVRLFIDCLRQVPFGWGLLCVLVVVGFGLCVFVFCLCYGCCRLVVCCCFIVLLFWVRLFVAYCATLLPAFFCELCGLALISVWV